jgi:hypothetical protein
MYTAVVIFILFFLERAGLIGLVAALFNWSGEELILVDVASLLSP